MIHTSKKKKNLEKKIACAQRTDEQKERNRKQNRENQRR